jgi:hypothetical protein
MSQNKTQGATSGAAAADTHSSAGAAEADKDSTLLEHSLGAAMDLSHVSPSRHPLNRLRRLSKEEPYVHSVAQTSFAGVGRLRNRRQSDPGRISVSPIRLRARALDNEIAETEELCHHPRLHALRSISMTVPEEMTPEEEEERSRPRERARQRAMRSNSLPTGDGPGFLEIGEAIGAVAMTQPPTIAELPPLVENITLSPNLMQARRRRSISMESTSLEAIDEDNNEVLGKKASSHVTPPSRTIHT